MQNPNHEEGVGERRPLLSDHAEQSPPLSGSDEDKIPPFRHALQVFETEINFFAKLAATMLNFVITGIVLSAVGVFIPEIERFYGINNARMATVFPIGVSGYLCSTLTTQYIHLHLGRRGLAWLSPMFRLLPAAILSVGPPFWLVLVAFFIFGFGTGLTDSGWCAWASAMPFPNVVQGFLHGTYCIGCITGPLLAVGLLNKGYMWFDLYRILFVAVITELVAQLYAFRHDNAARYRATLGTEESENKKPVNPLTLRATWMCGVLYFIYIAIESSYTDWVVVFMRRSRGMDYKTAGLASSVFWIGMTVGRICLGPVTEYCGLRVSVTAYLVLSVVFQAAFKLTTNVAASLVLLGLNGVVLAPTFPSGLTMLASKVSPKALVAAVSAAATMGQIGAASVPLGIGFMADKIGIGRMLDVVLSLTVVLVIIWVFHCRIS